MSWFWQSEASSWGGGGQDRNYTILQALQVPSLKCRVTYPAPALSSQKMVLVSNISHSIVCLSQTAEMIQQMDVAQREHQSCTEPIRAPWL